MDLLLDILIPRTDTAVAVQLLVVLVVFFIALRRFWSITELRLVVLGLGMIIFALFGVRALH